ncbi:hypothetical protein LTS08_008191 [Lithohypha guttulata]|nr:hypothetical protein LTS08_008191 [Lithohypha guttulata]
MRSFWHTLGPAKGYIEGLENRLHEAESLLLQILPHVTTEQLRAATTRLAHDDPDENIDGSSERKSSPPMLNKKTGVDYWETFPLTSVSDILRWQQDCAANTSIKENNTGAKSAIRNDLSFERTERQSGLDTRVPGTFSRINSKDTDLHSIEHARSSSMHGRETQRDKVKTTMNIPSPSHWRARTLNGSTDMTQHNPGSSQVSFENPELTRTSYTDLNTWQLQSTMQMDLDHDNASQQEIVPTINNVQSHLFW